MVIETLFRLESEQLVEVATRVALLLSVDFYCIVDLGNLSEMLMIFPQVTVINVPAELGSDSVPIGFQKNCKPPWSIAT